MIIKMTFLNLLLLSGFSVFIYMTSLYFLSLILKDSSIADIGWGIGFVIIAVIGLITNENPETLNYLITLLVSLWGIRLSAHIFLRNRGKAEDWRYKKWRDDWGRTFLVRSYLQIFILQGIFMLMISLPIIFVHSQNDLNINIFSVLGTLVWVIGFIFETIGDYQLSQFKSKPTNKGKIMTQGLWQYTRHPNYFGEVTQWWGIFIVVVVYQWGFMTMISPITITFLILGISGIPMLEKKYRGNKEFEEYKKRTSAFFPWLPKKKLS